MTYNPPELTEEYIRYLIEKWTSVLAQEPLSDLSTLVIIESKETYLDE